METSVSSIAIVGKDAKATVKFQEDTIGAFRTSCEITINIPNGASLKLADIPDIAIQQSHIFLAHLCRNSEQERP